MPSGPTGARKSDRSQAETRFECAGPRVMHGLGEHARRPSSDAWEQTRDYALDPQDAGAASRGILEPGEERSTKAVPGRRSYDDSGAVADVRSFAHCSSASRISLTYP